MKLKNKISICSQSINDTRVNKIIIIIIKFLDTGCIDKKYSTLQTIISKFETGVAVQAIYYKFYWNECNVDDTSFGKLSSTSVYVCVRVLAVKYSNGIVPMCTAPTTHVLRAPKGFFEIRWRKIMEYDRLIPKPRKGKNTELR